MAGDRVSSNAEWQKWGEKDPLYGVSSNAGKGRGEGEAWNDEEFYAMGEVQWREIRSHWEKYGLDTANCVEIGCGAGRITAHLAGTFRGVQALDVSKDMIEYARARIPASHVAFHVTNGVAMPLAAGSASAVFSTHVFQHFDSPSHASAYFTEISRVLKPGGTIMIHLPLYRWPSMRGLFEAIYRSRKAIGGVIAAIRRRLLSLGARPPMRYLSYSMDYLLEVLPKAGFTDVEVWIFCPERNHVDPHPFVLARKAPAVS